MSQSWVWWLVAILLLIDGIILIAGGIVSLIGLLGVFSIIFAIWAFAMLFRT